MSDLRGYNYSNVSLGKIKKDKFILSPKLEAQISRDELKMKMINVLKNDGKVYFISKKREVCGVVIIKYEKHLASEFEIDHDDVMSRTNGIKASIIESAIEIEDTIQDKFGNEKSKKIYNEKKRTANAYVLDGLYLTEELSVKEQIIMFDMMSILKELAIMNDLCVKVIIWADTIIADKNIGKTSESSAILIGVCLGMMFGVMLGILFENISLGMCLGTAFGSAIGSAIGMVYYGTAKFKTTTIEKKTESEDK